jgi:hypothetical protein
MASASDLTSGEDGSSLAGNPLAVIRRRRRAGAASDLEIRNLLRRFEGKEVDVEDTRLPSRATTPNRLAPPDVRIRSLASRGGLGSSQSAGNLRPTFSTQEGGEVLLLE